MRNRSYRWLADLAFVAAWTVGASGAVLVGLQGLLRIFLLVPLVLLFPGYAIVSVLYPEHREADLRSFDDDERDLGRAFTKEPSLPGIERLALSLLLSVIVVPGIVLVVNFTAPEIALLPILLGVAGVTLFGTVAAAVSRARLSPDDRYAPTVPYLVLPTSKSNRSLGQSETRLWSVLFALSLVLLASSTAYAVVSPPESPQFTELYLKNGTVDGETTSLYPSTLTQGQPTDLNLTVVNHENEQTRYSYVVLLERIDRNGGNASVERSTRVDGGSFTVADDEERNVTATVRPGVVGTELRVVVLLYKGNPPSNPSIDTAYRSLRLPVDVVTPSQSGSSRLAAPTVPSEV